MSDITVIKRELAAKAQSVAPMLLPNGRKESAEWRVGSVAGEPGQSLGVHLKGEKAGIWSDFNTGQGGDLLDLWAAVRGMTLAEAIEDARDWLGMERPQFHREPKRQYTRPPKPQCTKVEGRVLDYLTEDRNIPQEVLDRYKVAAQGENIVFPFLLPNGELAMAKTRKAEDGANPKPTAADCEPVLFGWQAVPTDARDIVIAEGEIDALAWGVYGYNAVSVPYGGGGGAKQQWIENEFERMDRFERIYLATDMDSAGDEAAEAIADRLGRHRCYRVKMPFKDGNDCLVEGVTAERMAEVIKEARPLDPEGLKKPSEYKNEVMRLFWPAHEEELGYRTPYPKLGDKLLFRPAEVTLWIGAKAQGKSQILSDCIVDWVLDQNSRVCVASLEMKGEVTLKRMCKQAGAVERPSAAFGEKILDALDRGLLLYDKVGKAPVDDLLDVFDYARAKYGCDQFVADSLMRLGVGRDDYQQQAEMIFKLVDWAIQRNVHLHLVAHARKGERGRGVPDIEDARGAGEIADNAFNVLAVHRVKERDEGVDNAETEEEAEEWRQKPGVILNVAAQRNGDFTGKVGLWFDTETYRYRSSYNVPMDHRTYVRMRDTEAA